MAFTLKKHTSNQLESARLNDVNQNWTDIETAIDALQTNASLLAEQVWSGNIEVPHYQDPSGSLEVPLSKQVATGSVLAIRVSRSPSDSRNDQVLFISANRSVGYARYCSASDTLFGYYTSGNKFYIDKRDASSSFYIKSIWDMSGLFG